MSDVEETCSRWLVGASSAWWCCFWIRARLSGNIHHQPMFSLRNTHNSSETCQSLFQSQGEPCAPCCASLCGVGWGSMGDAVRPAEFLTIDSYCSYCPLFRIHCWRHHSSSCYCQAFCAIVSSHESPLFASEIAFFDPSDDSAYHLIHFVTCIPSPPVCDTSFIISCNERPCCCHQRPSHSTEP